MSTVTLIDPTELAAVPLKLAGKSRAQLIAMRGEILQCAAEEAQIKNDLRKDAGMLPDANVDDVLNSQMGLSVKTRELATKLKAIRQLCILRMHIENTLRDDDGPVPAPLHINSRIAPLLGQTRGLLHRWNAIQEGIAHWEDRRPVSDSAGLVHWTTGMEKLRDELREIGSENSRLQAEIGKLADLKLTEV